MRVPNASQPRSRAAFARRDIRFIYSARAAILDYLFLLYARTPKHTAPRRDAVFTIDAACAPLRAVVVLPLQAPNRLKMRARITPWESAALPACSFCLFRDAFAQPAER